MELQVRGRVRVVLNNADISAAMHQHRSKHSPMDSVLNYALDNISHLGRGAKLISHNIQMPDRAIVNFRVGAKD